MDEIVGGGQGARAGGSVEGALGGSDGTQGEGTTHGTQDNSNTQGRDKPDRNNNSIRGQGLLTRGLLTRAHRRPYGRTLGRGGKEKYD